MSNADAIAEAMEPFTEGDDPDVVLEIHSHWAVGHVDGSRSGSTGTGRSPTPSASITSYGAA